MTTLGVDSEFRQLPPIYGWRIPPQEEEALRISYWILLDILAWSTAKQDIGFLYLTTLTALSPAEKYWTVPPSAFYDDCEQKKLFVHRNIYISCCYVVVDYCKNISTYFPTGWSTPEQKNHYHLWSIMNKQISWLSRIPAVWPRWTRESLSLLLMPQWTTMSIW